MTKATLGATSDANVGIMTTLGFQYLNMDFIRCTVMKLFLFLSEVPNSTYDRGHSLLFTAQPWWLDLLCYADKQFTIIQVSIQNILHY